MLLILLGCTQTSPLDSGPSEVPWSSQRPRLDLQQRDRSWARGIVHLHSPWSHDACDGAMGDDGEFIEDCLQDLREGLCQSGMDFAYLTDHPGYAAHQDYDDTRNLRDGEEDVDGIAGRMECGTLVMPGFEDELMPVGMERAIAETVEEREDLLNRTDQEAMDAMIAAGGIVLQAHTEGREPELLLEQQAMGQAGVEIFNLHAMFAPDIRSEDLGLDATGWVEDMAPFTAGEAEPDLFYMAVHQAQEPSLERWDMLLAQGPSVGVAGTDAHQNVLNLEMADGERVDSYRRMISWFSNWLLLDELSPQGTDEALAAGRNAVVFDVLGVPDQLDVHAVDGDRIVELGGSAAVGSTLSVSCTGLSETSPQSLEPPDLEVRILRDGQLAATGCGEHALDEAGVYRVEWWMTPHHLADFLGPAEHLAEVQVPWIHTGVIRAE